LGTETKVSMASKFTAICITNKEKENPNIFQLTFEVYALNTYDCIFLD
jgi:hypothetical protein